jgi:peptide/nickel transport system permease protein
MSAQVTELADLGISVDVGVKLSRGVFFRRFWSAKMGRAGLGILLFALLVAFVGRFFAPYSTTATIASTFQPPSMSHLLGTDVLGRDVLSRVLSGGAVIVGVSALATIGAYVAAVPLAMAAGLRKGMPEEVAGMAVVDLLLAFPPIVFILGLVAAAGPGFTIVVLGIASVSVPRIIRVVRTVAVELSTREFVEAAVARGERLWSLAFREIMPNIWTPTLADLGVRLTGAITLYASLSFLGVADQPPAANWGLMINENRSGLFLNPWAILAPAILIAILSIGANLVADVVARSAGASSLGRIR